MPGPVPERSENRRRYDDADKPALVTAEAFGITEWPEANKNWHPIAKQFYDSLQRSGQSKFYEDSDVAYAYYLVEGMSRSLAGAKISAQMFQAVLSGSNNLLCTEADRRRLRIELGRPDKDRDQEATDEMLSDYKDELADILPLRKES